MVYFVIWAIMSIGCVLFSSGGALSLRLSKNRNVKSAFFTTPCLSFSSKATTTEIKGFTSVSSTRPLPHSSTLSGIIAVHKPKGYTSNDILTKIKIVIKNQQKLEQEQQQRATMSVKGGIIKVGHGGTLDPLAEGVLVIGLGYGTKLLQSFLTGSKRYRAQAKLGAATDSLDSEGKVIETKDASHVTVDLLQSKMHVFQGNILQTPPMFSALRKDGKRLYDLARDGITIEREARPVTIYRLELITGKTNSIVADELIPLILPPQGFILDMECGGGVYVRSVIDDLARECNALAHMTALLRTKQGPFTIEDCMSATPTSWTYADIVANLYHCELKLRNSSN